MIADSVKALGVEATVSTPDADSWWDDRAKGEFDGILHWTDGGATPYGLYDSQIGENYLKPIGEMADYNFGRFENDEMATLLDSYRTADNDADRTKALYEFEKLWVENVPAIPIGNRPFIAIYSTRDFVGWPSEEDPYNAGSPFLDSQVQVLTRLRPAE